MIPDAQESPDAIVELNGDSSQSCPASSLDMSIAETSPTCGVLLAEPAPSIAETSPTCGVLLAEPAPSTLMGSSCRAPGAYAPPVSSGAGAGASQGDPTGGQL